MIVDWNENINHDNIDLFHTITDLINILTWLIQLTCKRNLFECGFYTKHIVC